VLRDERSAATRYSSATLAARLPAPSLQPGRYFDVPHAFASIEFLEALVDMSDLPGLDFQVGIERPLK
jgi:hypothetical protein